ncbi:BQ5605_C034g11344 [Microbotryum silenes-dioicae]|uniref:Peroxidase n=1 Tax=Microbotryum silenes-dioicae TaxID=796604 RepID=A0A2X0MGQ4_9BASI|nr:BQ5605_C034g11344 [Microbotryum silenes-dioicae]
MSFATRSLLRSSRFVAPRLAVRQPVLARRTYATGAPASGGSNTTLFALLGAAALGGGAYYAFSGHSDSDPTKIKDAASPQTVDYQKVYDAIAQVLEAEDYDDGSYGPVLVRLAWHASGTYDKTTGNGGSNGATMRFAPEANHGANAGLDVARNLLEPIKKQFPEITYSDLWTLAGVCAIQEMGGPTIPWRAGRKDGNVENCTPDGRLPDGDKGADHLRHIFYRMGFNDQEIVALSGAHAVGRCHTDRSGFSGPWQHSPTSFNNEYYKLLLNEKWQFKKWKGPIQYEDKSTKSLMMLTTDMALTTDKAFRPYTEQYAKDENKFFADFSNVFVKLIELGVPEKQLSEPLKLRPTGSE